MTKAVINQFLAQEPTSGSIVNVGSVASFKGFAAGEFTKISSLYGELQA
jgi:hypothetical protein